MENTVFWIAGFLSYTVVGLFAMGLANRFYFPWKQLSSLNWQNNSKWEHNSRKKYLKDVSFPNIKRISKLIALIWPVVFLLTLAAVAIYAVIRVIHFFDNGFRIYPEM